MFRHRRGLFRRRRSQLIDRLWNCRLLPTSSSRLHQGSVVHRDRADDLSNAEFDLGNAVGPAGQRSTSSGIALRDSRGTTGNGIQRYFSCFGSCCESSSSPISRLNNEEEDDNDGCRPDVVEFDSKVIFEESSRYSSSCTSSRPTPPPTKIMKTDAERLLFNLLDVSQLETLVNAVCCRLCDDDGLAGGCILVARQPDAATTDVTPGDRAAPHRISCGLWRWPEVGAGDDDSVPLKPMPCCVSSTTWNDAERHGFGESSVICCNPFHWSRLLQQPTSDLVDRDALSTDKEPVSNDVTPLSSSVSDYASGTATSDFSDDSVSDRSDRSWCTLAYWEHDRRVGPLYPVRDRQVEVFDRMARGTGLCLGLLGNSEAAENQQSTTSKSRRDASNSAAVARRRRAAYSVRNTREKIGPGIVISLEKKTTFSSGMDIVVDNADESCNFNHHSAWVYNRSRYPVFVSRQTSPARTAPTNVVDRFGLSPTAVGATTTIEKLPPGFAMRLFSDVCDQRHRSVDTEDEVYRRGVAAGICGRLRSAAVESRLCAQISFVKGWGSGYHRTCVTSCPCWIEVLIGDNHR